MFDSRQLHFETFYFIEFSLFFGPFSQCNFFFVASNFRAKIGDGERIPCLFSVYSFHMWTSIGDDSFCFLPVEGLAVRNISLSLEDQNIWLEFQQPLLYLSTLTTCKLAVRLNELYSP